MLKEKIDYKALKNTKQQEIYNFQKVSAIFADYGYTTIKLSDDWMGADFIAISFDGTAYLKVQLKGRLTFAKKYQGKDKNIHICFRDDKSGIWYLYSHDELLKKFIQRIEKKSCWAKNDGIYHYPSLNKERRSLLAPFALGT